MVRRVLVVVAAAALVALLVVPVETKGPSAPAGKSNVGHVYLYEKDPLTWEIVEGGAWGKMKYDLSGETFDFVFNGHELEPGEVYALIYYPDPWPGNDLICLGTDMADQCGNVHIAESVDTGDLPAPWDWNHPDNPNTCPTCRDGAKIWLVLLDEVDCVPPTRMLGWHPTEYLFEEETIFFEDMDD
jgi:hypothetical protein